MAKSSLTQLAALGAVGVSGALVVAFAGFVWLTAPRKNGIDAIQATVAWISIGLVALTLIAIHLVYAKVLRDVARGRRFGV